MSEKDLEEYGYEGEFPSLVDTGEPLPGLREYLDLWSPVWALALVSHVGQLERRVAALEKKIQKAAPLPCPTCKALPKGPACPYECSEC